MKVQAVLIARTLAFIDIQRLDPKGRIFFPELIKAITTEYSFQKPPEKPEMDEKKGLEFRIGRTGDQTIDALKIFDGLVAVETHSNTTESAKIIQAVLLWASKKFGLAYEAGMIRHWGFVNDLVFQTDFPLLDAACNPLTNVGRKTGKALSDIWKEPIEYQPIILSVGHDPMSRKNAIAPFTIQRRVETRFSENIYFSEAPLPTDVHIKLLEDFEAEVKARMASTGKPQ